MKTSLSKKDYSWQHVCMKVFQGTRMISVAFFSLIFHIVAHSSGKILAMIWRHFNLLTRPYKMIDARVSLRKFSKMSASLSEIILKICRLQNNVARSVDFNLLYKIGL